MAGKICDCCSREAETQVVCSAVGPVSFAYCPNCLAQLAEPIGCFYYLYDDVSDKGEGLRDDVKLLTTYKDGKYMTWDEFVLMRRSEK